MNLTVNVFYQKNNDVLSHGIKISLTVQVFHQKNNDLLSHENKNVSKRTVLFYHLQMKMFLFKN